LLLLLFVVVVVVAPPPFFLGVAFFVSLAFQWRGACCRFAVSRQTEKARNLQL
jgi:energy-coupling factor transporter transmembrane protein EcfT